MIIWSLLAASFVLAAETNDFADDEDPGDCTCDLTKNGCDTYCCCDSDCPGYVVDDWEDDELCVSEKFTDYRSIFCGDSDVFVIDNAKYGLNIITDAVNQVLCPVYINAPSSYSFHSVPDSADDSVLEERVDDSVDYSDLLLTTELDSSSSSYEPTSKVLITVSNWKRPWALPQPGPYGECVDTSAVEWLVSRQPESCTRVGLINDICLESLSTDTYLRGVHVSPSSSSTQSVEITSVSTVDLDNFLMGVDNSATTAPTTVLSNIGPTCENALLEAHYRVYSNSDLTQVTSIQADIVVGSLTSSSEVTVQQQFSVKFYTQTTDTFDRSGNPGYIVGLPVIAGTLVDSANMTVYEDGLSFAGLDRNGECTDLGAVNALSPLLLFGQEMLISCYTEMTFDELNSNCVEGDPLFFTAIQEITHFAKWGSIEPTNPDDWVEIEADSIATEPDFNPSSGTCSIPHTLVFNIVTAKYGPVENPHNKILSVRREYKEGTAWQFKQLREEDTQKFFYTIAFNFIEYDEGTELYVPIVLNPIPAMPDDILYPFKVSSAALLGTFWAGLFLANCV